MILRMVELVARPIDPRDGRWEEWSDRYRVDFWQLVEGKGWVSFEYEVAGGDVIAVMRWADEHAAPGQSYALYAIVDRDEDQGLVHLFGDDPTRNT
jgi:hypothetical protein